MKPMVVWTIQVATNEVEGRRLSSRQQVFPRLGVQPMETNHLTVLQLSVARMLLEKLYPLTPPLSIEDYSPNCFRAKVEPRLHC